MQDVLAEARKVIETRLKELEDEAQKLRDVLANLDGGKPTRRRRRRPPSTRRAPRGQRQEEFLIAVKRNPGVPVGQIAKEIGVAPQQLYPIARRLHQKGEIRKRGKGYAVKS
jgi:hypothetical protein